MSTAQYTAIRLRVADIVRELGVCLDQLSTADEIRRLPGDDANVDFIARHECFDDAATAMDAICLHADALREELEQLALRADLAASCAQVATGGAK